MKLATFRPSRHVQMVWRRRQQVREEVTGKLVPVEFELYKSLLRVAVMICATLVNTQTHGVILTDIINSR